MIKKNSKLLSYLFFFIGLLVNNVTSAATFTVNNINDSGTGSLRQAVIDANTTPGVDNIVFSHVVAGKIIKLTGGELRIIETLKITGASESRGRMRIDGGANSRIFFTDVSGTTLTLQDLVLFNGVAETTGGAINISGNNNTLILDRTLVFRNSVASISSNGGGIFCHGDVILNYSEISGNSVTGTGYSIGGGLHILGNLIANYSTISQNTASGGDYAKGGGAFVQGNIVLNNSSIWGNTVSGSYALGGGISILGREFFNISGNTILNQSTISGNSVISGNLLSEGGGGLHLAIYGEANLNQSTITNNSSNTGAGGVSLDNPTTISHTITISNSILSGNLGSEGNFEDRSAVKGLININNSLFGDPPSEITGTNIANIISASPDLRPLNDYGGPTYTNLPYADSLVVDAGSNEDAASFIYDQRGGSRFPRIVNGTVDIGAIERSSFSPAIFAIAPAGIINTATPTFSWNIVPGYNSYAIRALDSNGNVIFNSVTPINLSCPEGVCSFIKQGLIFPDAPASWQIRIKEEDDTSLNNEWSSPLDFTVVADGTVTSAIPLTPAGIINTTTPTFSWNIVPGYNSYAIRALDSNGNVIFNSVTPINLSCPEDVCSFIKQGLIFPDAPASWQIRIKEEDDTSLDNEWSSPLDFTVVAGGTITIAIPLTPTGIIDTATPTFTWTAAVGFDKYALRALDVSGNVVFSGVTTDYLKCLVDVCSFTVRPDISFPDGIANWQVRTEASDGADGYWSELLEFTVAAGGHSTLATPIMPSGTIPDENPIFTWTESPGFDKYALRLQDNLGNVIFSGVTPNGFSCENDVCSYLISNLILSDGEYTWRIRTEGDDRTDGFWSNPLAFLVKVP